MVIIIGVVWLAVLGFAIALCKAAARGDSIWRDCDE